MNVYEQSIVAYALPSLYHIYYLAPVDEEYRCGHGWLWFSGITIFGGGEERRGTIHNTSIPTTRPLGIGGKGAAPPKIKRAPEIRMYVL